MKKLNLSEVRPSDIREEVCEKFIQYIKQGIKFIEENKNKVSQNKGEL